MKLSDHCESRTLDDEIPELAGMPFPPEESIQVPLAEALDGGRHLALEREAAHLAVGDDVEPGPFLPPYGPEAKAVVDAALQG